MDSAVYRKGLRIVDDLAPNVRGAVAVGMVGVQHTDVGSTADELEILLGVSLR